MTSPKLLKAARENGKKGGRPPGKKTPAVIERDAAIKMFRDRVAKNTDLLFKKQLSLAVGAEYLFRIDKEWIKTGSNSKTGEDKGFFRNKKPVLVESPDEMMRYLENIVDIANGDIEDEHDEAASFYFLSGRDPQNNAIEAMLDRTYGRSKSEIDVNIKVPKPIYQGLSQPAKQLPAAQKPKKVKAVVIHEHKPNGV